MPIFFSPSPFWSGSSQLFSWETHPPLLSSDFEMLPPQHVQKALPGPLALWVTGILAAAQMGWERLDQGKMN